VNKAKKSASVWKNLKRGLPENECYVIIILLHHYPFSSLAINAISGAEERELI
jgi:hypothetical protein